ncbi:Cytochrome c [Planctomycetes bacterium Pan216]|uniref:Cytochrome c n=2 Tax=Kolteria novifilia TaxID=2527975 RepID=A0A518AXV0_9BACT|nr:Cytochrome c [Planctomycetes bacterium Pan216]
MIAHLACLLLANLLLANDRPPEAKPVQPGVQLELVAEHPDLATPTGIDVDDQGRVWLIATHTHFRPDDYEGPEHDEILVFSDADGDGKAETRQVFYVATDATMDLELGEDGWVYLAERDRIMRIKDSDGDGKADVEEDLAVLETKGDYPHNGLEGIAWHPDGDLLFGLGDNHAEDWTLTGIDGKTDQGSGEGGVFRCSPEGKDLRRVAWGFWNPFGVCARADGKIFVSDNDPSERPPCRLLHVVEGADFGYKRDYGPEAHHPFVCWNGEVRGTLPMIHPSGEAPCGLLPLGNGLLVPSWGDHRVDFFRLEPRGASYSAERVELVKGGRYFRPSCIAADPRDHGNKRVYYLTDWVDGRYQSHGYGRLWKLTIDLDQADWLGPLELAPPTKEAQLAAELRKGTPKRDRDALMALSRNDDPFIAQAALLALSKEAPSWSRDEVAKWKAEDRLGALLALRLAEARPNKIAAEDWMRAFLADEDAAIRFEALHWIADRERKEFLPDVERTLARSDLSYREFEAAMATWNTLNGKPEAGLRDPELLLARVKDAGSSPRLRAFALRLLPTKGKSLPKGVTIDLLRELLEVKDESLSLEAIRTLVANPAGSRELLAELATDSELDPNLRAEAILGLDGSSTKSLDLLLRLAEDESPPVREEALRGLRSRELTGKQRDRLESIATTFPNSADLARAALDPKALSEHRPELTDTHGWGERLGALSSPVDIASGSRIFHNARLALCINCHRHGGRGNVVGPDLSTLGRRDDRDWLLQSILEPSREMAPEYKPRTIVLTDGQAFTGIQLQSYTKEAIRDANGKKRTFNRDDIETIVESGVSFMPTGLVHSLTDRELRDLIHFLEGREPLQ